jgi:hypothetical protein
MLGKWEDWYGAFSAYNSVFIFQCIYIQGVLLVDFVLFRQM